MTDRLDEDLHAICLVNEEDLQICTKFMARMDLQKISKKFVPFPRSTEQVASDEYQ
jgi:hypothetical protein